ncbi:MAG: hypothetical protein LBM69_08520 [Lachnospiraceae bacterium]|jgi:hypothetical protein|nr:hypothetical protein [Lachnospiraceae bacterium]
MDELQYLEFDRNRYYYGKLMSVADFQLEQKYHNNKRRMQNRFGLGSGVLYGLGVVAVDEETISLEAGAAIDAVGREILVKEPITMNISDIEGSAAVLSQESGYAYLCLSYAQEEGEEVFNACGEPGLEANRYMEKYRVTLSAREPKAMGDLSYRSVLEDRVIVYEGRGIRLTHITPKFAIQNTAVSLAVEVENIGQTQDFSFSYQVPLRHLRNEDRASLKVDFDSKLVAKKRRYRLEIPLVALGVEAIGEIQAKGMPLTFFADATTTQEMLLCDSQIQIVEHDMTQAITEQYYKTRMHTLLSRPDQSVLYLAKLFLVKAGESTIVEEVEAMPFAQVVQSGELQSALITRLTEELHKTQEELAQLHKATLLQETVQPKRQITYGVYEKQPESGSGRNKGNLFVSEEIPHGHGPGAVNLVLTLENAKGELVSGDFALVRLSTKIFPDKGTFVIGILSREAARNQEMRVHWMAMKDEAKEEEMEGGRKVLLTKGFVELKTGESCYLDVQCRNMQDKRLLYRVKEQEGIVDQNGLYTAPLIAGIYEIIVESAVYANVETSLFAVVRKDPS